MSVVEGVLLMGTPFQVLVFILVGAIEGVLDSGNADSTFNRVIVDVEISHTLPDLNTSVLANVCLNRLRTVSFFPSLL
jgi:hypothetical protein